MGLKLDMRISLFLRTIAGHEIWHRAAWFETFAERSFWAYVACAGEVLTECGFTLALFQECGVASEVLLEQVLHDFSVRNKLVILRLRKFKAVWFLLNRVYELLVTGVNARNT